MSLKLLSLLKEFAVLIRIQNLGTSFTLVIGALTVKGFKLDLLDFLVLFLMAVLINMGGQISNDIEDYNVDKNSEGLKNRPLVKGTISIKSAKIIALLLAIIVLFLFYLYFPNVYAITVLFISFIFGYLYNKFSKKIPGSDFFLSISFSLFCLCGAIVVTDNFQSLSDISWITWIVVGMIFIHLQIMNSIEGGLKDAKNDFESGAKTMAVFMGVKAEKKLFIPLGFKIISITYVGISAILAFIPFLFLNFRYTIIQLLMIILLVLWMFFSIFKLLSFRTYKKEKIKFHIRNLELARYSLVPLILINVIGVYWAVLLIIFPIFWFAIFNFVFYRDRWYKPKFY